MSSNTVHDLHSSFKSFDPLLSSLPHKVAVQIVTMRYITVATLAVFVWEILISIFDDYKLLFKHRMRPPTIVYFLSRLCCLGFTISATLIRVESLIPPSTCVMLGRIVVIFFSTAVVFTSLLFFFRTRAIFDGHHWIIAVFAGLWLAVLGGSLAFIIDVFDAPKPAPHAHIMFCIKENINPFVAASTIIPLINDTLVFLAITWRLSRSSYARHTLKNGLRTLVLGDYLPVFSKALLQDGQAYYLTIITMNLIAVITLFDHSIPAIQTLRTMFTVPNVALMNIMACRVYRNIVLLGDARETDSEYSTIS